MTAPGNTSPGQPTRVTPRADSDDHAPTATRAYSYTRTYMRRRRYRPGWPARHRTATMLTAASAILLAYAAAVATTLNRLFPDPAGAYWVAALSAAALTLLSALTLWARRE